MKHSEAMKRISFFLEAEKGFCVLQCVYLPEEQILNEEELSELKNAHYRKIDLSDGIYVVDIGGYIGESVKKEIEYAMEKGKEIIYHSKYGV